MSTVLKEDVRQVYALFFTFSSFCYTGRVDEPESLMYYSDSQSFGLLNDENFEPAFDITPTPEQTVNRYSFVFDFNYKLSFTHA